MKWSGQGDLVRLVENCLVWVQDIPDRWRARRAARLAARLKPMPKSKPAKTWPRSDGGWFAFPPGPDEAEIRQRQREEAWRDLCLTEPPDRVELKLIWERKRNG